MTLKDISNETGLSIATVSRVLNNMENVSEEARKLVMDTAKRGGYFRKLKENARKGTVIAVIVPDLSNPFFADVIKGIQMKAEPEGKEVVIMNTCEDSRMEKRAVRLVQNLNLCGIIITPVSDQGEDGAETEQLLGDLALPVILIDRDVKNSDFDGVFLNNILGAFEAVEYLIQKGIAEIAVISGPSTSKPGRERLTGYLNALAKHQIPENPELILEGDFSIESGYTLTREILGRSRRPGAIFACNNLMTMGCFRALREEGVEIGSDIELVGFDEIELQEALGGKIATVNRPTVEMGKTAADILLHRLKETNEEQRIGRRIELLPKLNRKF